MSEAIEDGLFLDAVGRLDKAAQYADIDDESLERLRHLETMLQVSIPVRMDDGSLRIFRVRTSVSPKVIDCPEPQTSGKTTLSAVAKNGVELRIRATGRPVRRPCIHLASRAKENQGVRRSSMGIIHAAAE